ncbi:MAG: lysylphosphatidylglycerol synthase domain-containing protein [Actinomycetota bacterium]
MTDDRQPSDDETTDGASAPDDSGTDVTESAAEPNEGITDFAAEPSEALTEMVTEPVSRARQTRRIVLRVAFTVLTLAASFALLAFVFDDLDWNGVVDALRSLQDAEILALISMWVLWIGAQGLLTASLVPRLPVRRGVVAYLGPAGVTSIIPGPSDLPVRYQMFTSWGRSPTEATLAVAAGGVFSIGIKLVLPVVAAIGLVISGAPIDGTLRTVVMIALVVGIGLVIVAAVLSRESFTAKAGTVLSPVWAFVLRLLRRPDPPDLAERLVAARANALEILRDRWLIATWATFLTSLTRFALLLLALRFTGLSDSDLAWPQVFVAFALVQGLTVVPITAGDAGVTEVAYIGLLTAAAGSQFVNEITAGILLFRLLTWILIVPIGFATIGVWRYGLRRMQRAV